MSVIITSGPTDFPPSLPGIEGGDGNDVLDGSADSERLEGFSGDDVLNGNGGDDELIGGLGNDLLNGGDGFDAAFWDEENQAYSFILSNVGLAIRADGLETDRFTGVERIVASPLGANFLADASYAPNVSGSFIVLTLNEGDDIVLNSGLNVLVDYSLSIVGLQIDLANGDVQTIDPDLQFFIGQDVIHGVTAVSGSNENDRILGGAASETLIGGLGFDVIAGGAGDDSIFGDTSDGEDTSGSSDFIEGGAGDDTIDGGRGFDQLYGGEGDDTLLGGADDDALSGGPGDDILNGDGEDATPSQQDIADYSDAAAGIVVNLALGVATNDGDGGQDTLIGIERLRGSAFDDVLIGDDGVNQFIGGGGNDVLDGGGGVDTVDYSGTTAGVVADLAAGVATDDGDGGQDILTDIETLIGSQFDDDLTGSETDNSFFGRAGDDILLGHGGNDRLFGSIGDDFLVGGNGDDVLDGSDGFDTGDWSDRTQGFVFTLKRYANQAVSADGQENDAVTEIEQILGTNHGDRYLIAASLVLSSQSPLILRPGAGDDAIENEGFDVRVEYAAATAGVRIDLGAGTAASISGDAAGVGRDTLVGVNRIVAGAFDDILIGTASGQALQEFVGGEGSDVIDGVGGSNNLIGYTDLASGVRLDLVAGVAIDGFGAIDRLRTIQHVHGSEHADSLAGDGAENELAGGAGDDALFGRAGDDLLIGGAGDDAMDGGAGVDVVDYSAAASGVVVDLLSGVALDGDGGRDTLTGFETAIGSNFDDRFVAPDVGPDGSYIFSGGAGGDTVDFSGLANAVTVDLDAGSAMDGAGGVGVLNSIEHAIGTRFDDVMFARRNGSQLSGGAGDDLLVGNGGNDIFDGGDGFDIVLFDRVGRGLIVDLRDDTEIGSLNNLVSVEGIFGTRFNDTLIGDAADNLLAGERGDDAIDGGAGFDVVSFVNAQGGVVVDLAAGQATTDGFGGQDTLINIEALLGSSFKDVLIGDAGANELRGMSEADRLVGGAGDDLLDGGAGADVVDYSQAAAGVTVNLAIGRTPDDGDGGADKLVSIERAIGSAFDDVLIGNAGKNILMGGAGRDRLVGRDGDDRMVGGGGNDVYAVQDAGDVVIEDAAGGGSDHINVYVDYTNAANVEFLCGKYASQSLKLIGHAGAETIYGSDLANAGDRIDSLGGDDVVKGFAGNDFLNGNSGHDRLYGGAGDDVLRGGNGDDRLSGGAGADRFIHRPGDDFDRIGNFDAGEDLIDLTAHGFADFASVQALISEDGRGVLVDFGQSGAILLYGVAMGDIGAGAFLL